MIEARSPRYEWGMRVIAALNLYNDGSYPNKPVDDLLVKEGDLGEIVQVGTHEETQTPVYLVEFNETYVVGCLEEEIKPI
jgi:nitrogen fixation protein NifZ